MFIRIIIIRTQIRAIVVEFCTIIYIMLRINIIYRISTIILSLKRLEERSAIFILKKG